MIMDVIRKTGEKRISSLEITQRRRQYRLRNSTSCSLWCPASLCPLLGYEMGQDKRRGHMSQCSMIFLFSFTD